VTTPRSPRGARLKGDNGEGLVADALERSGLYWIDGKPTESGADGILIDRGGRLDHLAEVKARAIAPSWMEPKVKSSIARRAALCRSRNWAYILYFIRDDQPAKALKFTVGGLVPSQKRKGLSLELYEAGFLDLGFVKRPPLKDRLASPLPIAESRTGMVTHSYDSRLGGVDTGDGWITHDAAALCADPRCPNARPAKPGGEEE